MGEGRGRSECSDQAMEVAEGWQQGLFPISDKQSFVKLRDSFPIDQGHQDFLCL